MDNASEQAASKAQWNPAAIVADLEARAAMLGGCCLAIYFESGTVFVVAGEKDNVGTLTHLLALGGYPMAHVYVRREGGKLDVLVDPLPPVAAMADPEVAAYLHGVAAHFSGVLAAKGVVRPSITQ